MKLQRGEKRGYFGGLRPVGRLASEKKNLNKLIIGLLLKIPLSLEENLPSETFPCISRRPFDFNHLFTDVELL